MVEESIGSSPAQQAFLEALTRLKGTSYEFEGFLSNHGPMGCDALVSLGRSDEILPWVDLYRVRLDVEAEPQSPIGPDTWPSALGDISRVADWSAFLQRELAENSWTDVLARWWRRLMPGMAAAGTHGLIRTAHAVRALSRNPSIHEGLLLDELAHGLGYWAARYQELPVALPSLVGPHSAATVLGQLARSRPTRSPEAPGITPTLLTADSIAGFDDVVAEVGVNQADVQNSLTDLTSAAATTFFQHPGRAIPMVHSVTAPAAVRMVLQWLPAELHLASLAQVWRVSASIVGTFASPNPVEPGAAVLIDDLIDMAVANRDEHVIKMTEACLREFALRPDDAYLLAALAAIKTIDPFE